jgi:phage baseplate assembly protein W
MTTPVFSDPIGWPLGGLDEDGRLPWSRDERALREAMLNILLTRPGERLMRPEFGAGLTGFVHQPNNETTRRLIAGVVRRSLARWEPRIVVEAVEVLASTHDPSEVHVRVAYRARHRTRPEELGLTLSLEPST